MRKLNRWSAVSLWIVLIYTVILVSYIFGFDFGKLGSTIVLWMIPVYVIAIIAIILFFVSNLEAE